jgi:predicted Ser/Thr protein kinase
MQTTNDPNEWIEEAVSKKFFKYYDYKDFYDIQIIGKGGFGKVYRANWKNSEQYLALKTLSNLDNVSVKEVVKEVTTIVKDVITRNS